jgi:outer membrane phospholipase A
VRARLIVGVSSGACLAVAQTAAPPATSEPAAAAPLAAAPATAPPKAGAEKAQELDQPELDVLTFYRSNYFVSGFTRETQVKFQFSIKYDLWPNTGHHTVYLAYTQKSLWDLYDTSAPFRESNYAPELFYAHYHAEMHGRPTAGCGLFGEQLGFEHESNGEQGDASRAWNRVFGDIAATCHGQPLYGMLGLRVWYPFLIEENDTIATTQGYGELRVAVGIDEDALHVNGLVSVALRKGTSSSLGKGSVVVDARWRPTYQRLLGKAWKFAPFLWFQYFAGYGETLRTFDRASSSARLGIGFTDQAR